MAITKSTLDFLQEIEKNNNREWFQANKPRYVDAQEEMKSLLQAVVDQLEEHDQIERVKHFRIYRDIRFSKDKTPYKSSLSASIKRAGANRRGGMYFHLQPGDRTYVGGGFWGPEKHDLQRIRAEIDLDAKPLRKIIESRSFKETFGDMSGDKVKTAPKGFSKDHPAIDLIRHKSFVMGKHFTDQEVLSEHFTNDIVKTYRKMYPFFDYFTQVLTTNINGESII